MEMSPEAAGEKPGVGRDSPASSELTQFENLQANHEIAKEDLEQQQVVKPDLTVQASPVDEKSTASKPAAGPGPPPDGGYVAWLQVFGSYFLFFNTWGLINAYGAFQTYYQTELLPNTSPSDIAWVGSVQSFIILFIGTIAGPLFDAGYFNALIRTGGFLLVLGLMMTSLCTELWQLVLAQGICTGIGGGLLFLPSIAIVPQYFTSHKSLATGIASTGSSTGGIIYPIVFHRLQPRIGFPWATRVVAFIALATVIVPILVMRVRVYPQAKRKLIQLDAFKDSLYSLNCLTGFIAFIGFFGPFFYLEAYSLSQPQDNKAVAFYLLPIILAGSFFGRLVPNLFADKTGPFMILIPATLLSGMLALCWIAIHSTPGLIAFAVFFGFFTGGLVSLTPLTIIYGTKDLRDIGTRMGMYMAIASLAVLVGAPTLGAILNARGDYLGVQLFTGIFLVAGGLLFIPTSILTERARKRWAAEKAANAGAN